MSRTVPDNTWDSHMHVVDPLNFPLSPQAVYVPQTHSLSDAQRFESKLGVQNVVLVQPSIYGNDNSCLLSSLIVLGPRHARAVVQFDPYATDGTTLQIWDKLGVRGVRLNLASTKTVLPAQQLKDLLHACADRIRPLGWALQLYIPLHLVEDLEETLAALNVNVVLDHFGNPDLTKAVLKLRDETNKRSRHGGKERWRFVPSREGNHHEGCSYASSSYSSPTPSIRSHDSRNGSTSRSRSRSVSPETSGRNSSNHRRGHERHTLTEKHPLEEKGSDHDDNPELDVASVPGLESLMRLVKRLNHDPSARTKLFVKLSAAYRLFPLRKTNDDASGHGRGHETWRWHTNPALEAYTKLLLRHAYPIPTTTTTPGPTGRRTANLLFATDWPHTRFDSEKIDTGTFTQNLMRWCDDVGVERAEDVDAKDQPSAQAMIDDLFRNTADELWGSITDRCILV